MGDGIGQASESILDGLGEALEKFGMVFSQSEHNAIETVLEDGNNDSISGNNEEKPLLLQAVSWAGRGLKGNSKNVGG